eukprot:c13159_g1_i1 orf=108-326(-)
MKQFNRPTKPRWKYHRLSYLQSTFQISLNFHKQSSPCLYQEKLKTTAQRQELEIQHDFRDHEGNSQSSLPKK